MIMYNDYEIATSKDIGVPFLLACLREQIILRRKSNWARYSYI